MTVSFRRSVLLACGAPLLLCLLAASPYQKEKPAEEPRYDTATSVDWIAVVTAVKDVAAGSALGGTHVLVRPESARSNSEPIDVYVAPDDYLKDFGCHFAKGDKIQVKGSKVKYGASTEILAREVRLESITVYLRDDQGVPYWKKS